MQEENRLLFSKALYTALNERFDEELSSCVDIKPSKRHISAIKAIIREQKIININRRKLPMRLLVAAILATTLFLTGCFTALIYRNEFKTFIEEIYTDHISLIFSNKEGTSSDEVLEKIYELIYLPEGYELVNEENIYDQRYYHYYKNKTGEEIVLKQYLSSSAHINLDNGEAEILNVGNKEVYIYVTENLTFSFWESDNSTLDLSVPGNIDKEDIVKIIENIGEKSIE